MLHKETNHIAPLTRTEILKDTLGRRDHEGGRFFIGKRTQPLVIGPAFLQGYKVRYHLHNVGGIEDLIDGLLIDHFA